jgi:hypothetical protein
MPARAPEGASSRLPPTAEATRAATAVLGAAVAGLAAAYALLPAQRDWLIARNGLTDSATTLLLAAASAAGWWAIRRTPGEAWRHLLPLAALLALADEVRLGTGLFGFHPPRVGPVTIDGVSSLFAVGRHLASTRLGLGPADLGGAAALLAAVGAVIMARRRRAARAAAWLADRPAAVHLLVASVLATAAIGLQLLAGGRSWSFVEEWLEFSSGALLLRGALVIAQRDPRAVGWRQRLRPWLEADSGPRAMPASARRGRP